MNKILIEKVFLEIYDPVVLMGLCWSSLLDNQRSDPKIEFFVS